MLTQEEIQRLDNMLAMLKEWREEIYKLLTDKERIVGCNCDEIACICNKEEE